MPRTPFIPFASPKLRPAPPTGPEWLHEVKFDGFRIQLHKAGDEVRLFSRNGKDFTDRFPSIAAAVRRLAAKDAVIDGELVSCDETDKPDFYALMRRRTSGLCVWCFDLLMLGGRDLQIGGAGKAQGQARGAADEDRRHRRCGSPTRSPMAKNFCTPPLSKGSRASSANGVLASTSPARPRAGSR